jgi:hypothetical protein
MTDAHLPCTKLHQRLHVQGRLIGQTTGNNLDGTTNFIPRMNRETLRAGYRNLMGHIYSPGPYYQRIRTFLRESAVANNAHHLNLYPSNSANHNPLTFAVAWLS